MIQKVVLMLLISLFVVTACANGGTTVSPASPNDSLVPVPTQFAALTNPLSASAASAGADVFQTNCEMCHGPQGHGDGPAGQALDPKPRNLAELQTTANDGFLFWRIHEGKPGTSMVAWKGILTDDQIWQVITFLRTLK